MSFPTTTTTKIFLWPTNQQHDNLPEMCTAIPGLCSEEILL